MTNVIRVNAPIVSTGIVRVFDSPRVTPRESMHIPAGTIGTLLKVWAWNEPALPGCEVEFRSSDGLINVFFARESEFQPLEYKQARIEESRYLQAF